MSSFLLSSNGEYYYLVRTEGLTPLGELAVITAG
jgi:hypothetical protein